MDRDGVIELNRIGPVLWEIPRTGTMRVCGRVYGDETLVEACRSDGSLRQVANVASLPGIVGSSLGMPDIHRGSGCPLGGVAAMRVEDGVVSPGGVGYDINCGVRLVATDLEASALRERMRELVVELYRSVPCGVGAAGGIRSLSERELRGVCERGSAWAVEQGYGSPGDLERTEDGGCVPGADVSGLSGRAVKRGLPQLGTLGSGNHFLEVGCVDAVYDEPTAAAYGLRPGGLTLLIHSGSRGFGYQICDDALRVMVRTAGKYGIQVPDRQLACAPVASPEGQGYLAAMACAANYAWANRQVIMALALQALSRGTGMSVAAMGPRLVYDVCHNMAKIEEHRWRGRTLRLCVHRKGATRAFGGGHPGIPPAYQEVGQPVLIPGDMGRASFVCAGTEEAMTATFGSTCHGAGRVLSRTQAKKAARGRSVLEELEGQGIAVMARSRQTLAEEMPEAYKDVGRVVGCMHEAGISRKVVRLRPLGVIKG